MKEIFKSKVPTYKFKNQSHGNMPTTMPHIHLPDMAFHCTEPRMHQSMPERPRKQLCRPKNKI